MAATVVTCTSCRHRYGPEAYRQHRASVRGREHCYRPWRLPGFAKVEGVWRYVRTPGRRGDSISAGTRPSSRELVKPWTDDERGEG